MSMGQPRPWYCFAVVTLTGTESFMTVTGSRQKMTVKAVLQDHDIQGQWLYQLKGQIVISLNGVLLLFIVIIQSKAAEIRRVDRCQFDPECFMFSSKSR